MQGKNWYESKTIWAGAIIAIYGILAALGVDVVQYKELIISLAGAMGLIGVRQAIDKK